MLRYSKFMFSIISRKKSLYFTFLFMVGLVFLMTYLNINRANNAGNQGLRISTFISWFPFVFGSIVSSLLIMRIFKTGETDGTELIISAKPLTRAQIILGKFFTHFVILIFYQILCFGVYFSIALLDKYATLEQKLRFASSLTIGGFIIMIIINALIIIVSAFLNKVGIIIVAILFSAGIPIISFTMVPIANAEKPRDPGHNRKYFFYNLDNDNPKQELQFSPGYIYNNKKESQDFVKASKKNAKSWYRNAKYVDFWYQWGRLYSLFQVNQGPRKGTPSEIEHAQIRKVDDSIVENEYQKALKSAVRIKWPHRKDYKTIATFSQFAIDTYNKLISFNDEEYKKIITDDTKKLRQILKSRNFIKALSDFLENNSKLQLNLMSDKDYWNKYFDNLKTNVKLTTPADEAPQIYLFLWKLLSDISYKHKDFVIDAQLFRNYFSRNNIAYINKTKKIVSYRPMMNFMEISDDSLKNNIINSYQITNTKVANNVEFITINFKPFLALTPITILWSSIAFILFSVSIVIYMRRDFR